MLHTYITRFDVIATVALFENLVLELNVAYYHPPLPKASVAGSSDAGWASRSLQSKMHMQKGGGLLRAADGFEQSNGGSSFGFFFTFSFFLFIYNHSINLACPYVTN